MMAQPSTADPSIAPPYDNARTSGFLCTSLTASTIQGMLAEAQEAQQAGADIVELRIDFLKDLQPDRDLPILRADCPLPAIVTYRPTWEDPNAGYTGPEPPRLATLKYALELGFSFIDIELKAAPLFFSVAPSPPPTAEAQSSASAQQQQQQRTGIIISQHNYDTTPDETSLLSLVHQCREAGADIVKFATMAQDISDAARVLTVLEMTAKQGPVIALAMGERGQITRLLAPKYGGFLTFGALSPQRATAPGQPALEDLEKLYRLKQQSKKTKVFGIVGNPVSHSKSPAIHNASFADRNVDSVYVPLLVDDMPSFLKTFSSPAFKDDWLGFSVTIPHKGAALKGAAEADPVAAQIGAVNTLIRQADGGMKGYNTDWSAAISAIERGLVKGGKAGSADQPLLGKMVVVIGAGGAGRALAFGAASRGAKAVVIANRNKARAEELAASLAASSPSIACSACALDDLASFSGDNLILVNTTSVGMHPHEDETPVSHSTKVLSSYQLVFDAVYTPRYTKLLREAGEAGCLVVTGDEMFVGQAADQFKLFTNMEAPVELMRRVVLGE